MDNPADMITVDVDTLDGWQLDWAVTTAVKAWTWAHELYPTMTLDPTFGGCRVLTLSDGQTVCQIVPNNPMRQDPETFSPRSNWAHGGPIIDKHSWALPFKVYGSMQHLGAYAAKTPSQLVHYGPTPLIASMRAIVAASYGLKVKVPAIATAGEKS